MIFAGDSAHIVSPFGARGGNSGIQDVDNLVWKLAMVVKGEAPESLIASYDEERIHGADENIRHSSRATAFLTPKTAMEKIFRDSVLELAGEHDFARKLVNSGRLVAAMFAGWIFAADQRRRAGLDWRLARRCSTRRWRMARQAGF